MSNAECRRKTRDQEARVQVCTPYIWFRVAGSGFRAAPPERLVRPPKPETRNLEPLPRPPRQWPRPDSPFHVGGASLPRVSLPNGGQATDTKLLSPVFPRPSSAYRSAAPLTPEGVDSERAPDGLESRPSGRSQPPRRRKCVWYPPIPGPHRRALPLVPRTSPLVPPAAPLYLLHPVARPPERLGPTDSPADV